MAMATAATATTRRCMDKPPFVGSHQAADAAAAPSDVSGAAARRYRGPQPMSRPRGGPGPLQRVAAGFAPRDTAPRLVAADPRPRATGRLRCADAVETKRDRV